MGSSMMYVKVFELNQWTTKVNTQMGPRREFDDFSLRIDSSIGELLLLLYKSGFYRRE